MVLVYEPICYGYEHVPINTSIIKILLASGEKDILFYGEEYHCKLIADELNNLELNYVKFKYVVIPTRKLNFQKRIFSDLKNIYSILAHASKQPVFFVITSANPSVLISTKIAKPLFFNTIIFKIILHGGISVIDGWRSKNPFLRMIDFTGAISWLNCKSLEYFVLEESIYNNVISTLPHIKPYINYIDHPILDYKCDIKLLNVNDEKTVIRIGYLGVVNESKGFDEFIDVAERIKSEMSGFFKFYVIGHSQKTDVRYSEIFEYGPKYDPIDRSEYLSIANMMHYICFPYREDHYKFSASGALLDAIYLRKPIIATDIQIFESLFNKYGDIGYKYKEGTLYQAILSLINDHNLEKYSEFVNRLAVIREDRLPKNQINNLLLINTNI